MRKPTLIINGSYEPLRITTAKRALTLITKGTAVVEVATDKMIYPGIYLPSVIRLRYYHRVPIRMQTVSRKNIFIRDGYKCLYCGHKKTELELEHVIPRCRGGLNSWNNLVTSCHRCNQKKGDKTPEEAGMKLIHKPIPANIHTPRFILKALGSEINEWDRFLFNDSEGERRLVAHG